MIVKVLLKAEELRGARLLRRMERLRGGKRIDFAEAVEAPDTAPGADTERNERCAKNLHKVQRAWLKTIGVGAIKYPDSVTARFDVVHATTEVREP